MLIPSHTTIESSVCTTEKNNQRFIVSAADMLIPLPTDGKSSVIAGEKRFYACEAYDGVLPSKNKIKSIVLFSP